MIDFDILAESGTTNARLREFFTAKLPSNAKLRKMDPAEKKAIEKDIENRKKFETMLSSWMTEQVIFSLNNHNIYSAVDLAWDSMPIQKHVLPLIMYAQGRIDIRSCQTALKDIPNGEKYVRKNKEGQAVSIDLPKFCETNINLVRSIITRRVAAQANKYNQLSPHFKYESRSNGQVGKLRAEAVSQRMDIMADQYSYRHQQTQEIRDMFLYGHCVSFPRCSWEREVQWVKASTPVELDAKKKIKKVARVMKEGVCFVTPHPTRLICDNNYPLTSLNSDIGCEYMGFWDVCRWGDIADNPEYFNRNAVSFSADTAAWFTTYSIYFNQYFDKISPPGIPQDPTAGNDRKNNVGVYTGEMRDTGAFFTDMRVKIIPRNWGLGDYPYPIWLHLKTAGDSTVVYADIMPSSPAVVSSYNENDSRLVNLSVAHELMSYQDQLTNLFTQLLEATKADLFSMAILNEDIFPDSDDGAKLKEEFKSIMKGNNFYASMQVLTVSFSKLAELGISTSPDNIFKIVRSAPNTAITAIFEAITKVIAMAEKMMVLSSQEQGQPAPREISATETNQIAGSTEAIYAFIGQGIDEAREAKKRVCYESLVAKGEDIVTLPVINRYPHNVITKAGFKVVQEDLDDEGGQMERVNITGSKESLVHDYIFTSRDGSERATDSQAAQTLVQLVQAIGSMRPEIGGALLKAMGKEKVFEIFNEIFRKSDTGMDLRLELQPGDDNGLMMEDDQQVMGQIQRLGAALKQTTDDVAQIKQALMGPQQSASPQPAAMPPAAGSPM